MWDGVLSFRESMRVDIAPSVADPGEFSKSAGWGTEEHHGVPGKHTGRDFSGSRPLAYCRIVLCVIAG